ncbi:hypothetical protein I7I51_05911 [Histoplasma capsulatum]|uniref:Uncharacterized protein n=1 Tax=Ajellomyces capsulatus TaxID=5037 RepID=A0A8A1MIW6_AJECA|nr:hypothetical protein I7I51_05911 [Histoplasma capsulatum]
MLGCTFYTYITSEQDTDVCFGLNDFYCIDGWTLADHNTSHTVELVWLNERVAALSTSESDRMIVIFTQHIPITDDSRAVDPVHVGSTISSRFSSDLSGEACWKNPNVGVREP